MSIPNRASKITKAHKVLKKHYKPYVAADRPLLEHLLYACCLQSATHEAADEAFAKLQQAYYDWNEVRVTTISELAELMTCLPQPAETASRLKRSLQSIFEAYYSFDLDGLKKENIGKAVKQLERLNGITDFALAFVVQNGLGGHAIAVSSEAFEALRVAGIVTDDEAAKRRVPGMERAISKSKGVEFGALLHQLGADYAAAPFSPRVRAVLLEIAPDAKDRFPKRTTKKAADEGGPAASAEAATAPAEGATKKDDAKTADARKKNPPPKKAAPKLEIGKKQPPENPKKSTTKKLSKRKPR
jgi:endonuclease III